MLQAQAQWYPGWKLCSHIPLVKIERFLIEITKYEAVVTQANGDADDKDEEVELELLDDLEKPDVYVCPGLNKRIDKIQQMHCGQSRLKPGWLIVDDGADDEMPVNWTALELKDSTWLI
jgi:hypothetical protein